jgi:hypothetical protein
LQGQFESDGEGLVYPIIPLVPIFFYICFMKGIVITAKSQTEYRFLSDLLKKLGISSATMSAEDLEDLGLSKLMKSVNKSKKVSRETIMAKLKS